MHWQEAYRTGQSLPESERASAEVISLPMHPYLEDADLKRVAAAVRRAVGESS
jgi:dTDP-4-amino-4,6-dideoxygalactose transaminase